MAFISKNSRKIEFSNSTGTGSTVAPNSYDLGCEMSKFSPNLAAFNQSVKKENSYLFSDEMDKEEIDEVVRIRNNFEYESKMICNYLRKPMPTSNFDSSSNRLPKMKGSKLPDPGVYYDDPVLKQIKEIKQQGAHMRNNQAKNIFVQRFKEKNPFQPKPSIPGKLEMFGYTYQNYQSDSNQKMVKNTNPEMLSGDVENSVGPGEYNPTPQIMKNHVSAPKMIKTIKNPRTDPNSLKCPTGNEIGPGIYDLTTTVPGYKYRQNASFLYAGPRSMIDEEIKQKKIMKWNQDVDSEFSYIPSTIPGPGAYYNPKRDSQFRSNNRGFKFQIFGSGSSRFCGTKKHSNSVGPGSYNLVKPSAEKRSHNQKMGIGFNSEAKRDMSVGSYDSELIPGPGAYIYPYEMAKVVQKKNAQPNHKKRREKMRSDLTTKKKETDSVEEIPNPFETPGEISMDGSPGPGSYHQAHENPRIKQPIKNSVFSSGLNRFKGNDEEIPPLGAYELNQLDISKRQRKARPNAVSFNCGAQRWRRLSEDQMDEDSQLNLMGGGNEENVKYKFTGAFGGGFRGGLCVDTAVQKGDHAPFGTNVKRMQRGNFSKATGPGDYYQNPTMEKRSYNILFM